MPDSRWPHLVLVVAGGLAMPLLTCWLRAYLRQDLPRCASCLRAVPAWPALCLALATLATTTYFLLARAVVARWGFCDDFTLFESDAPLYVHLMSGDVVGEHAITLKHPLFILLTRSLYLAAQPLSGMHTPVLLNALAGGAALALAAAYFHAITGSRALALLLAVTLGISTAHLVFAALPETYAFSAAGLILLHLLLAARPRHHVRLRHEVPAAALAIGITLTHIATAVVCFFAARAWRSGWRASPRWAAGVLALLAVGLVVQTALVPASAIANSAGAVRAEQRHMTGELTPPITRAAYNVARGMLAENVVAPGLVVRADTDAHVGLHLGRYDSALGRICMATWWLLWPPRPRDLLPPHHARSGLSGPPLSGWPAPRSCTSSTATPTCSCFPARSRSTCSPCWRTLCACSIVAAPVYSWPCCWCRWLSTTCSSVGSGCGCWPKRCTPVWVSSCCRRSVA
jgi:hypothetical protein